VLAWSPQVAPALLAALAIAAAGVLAAPTLLARPHRPAAFAAVAGALMLALVLAIAASHHGVAGWYQVFDYRRSFEAKNEYLPALPALGYGARFFLDHFAELVPSLPVHTAGHPPGLLLTIHALGITTAQELAALCIAATAALAPLTYAAARRVLPEPRARAAALLVAFSPVAAIIGVSSADAIYAALGLVAAIGLLAGTDVVHRRSPCPTRGGPRPRGAGVRAVVAGVGGAGGAARIAGAVALAVGSFFSWALVAVGVFAVLVELRTRGLRRAAALAALCAAALVAFYAALYAVTGFDPVGTVRATHQVYAAGIASTRPYAFWVFGSPVAWGVAIGLPTALYALRALAAANPLALALAAIVVAASVLGLTKAETERIWLFLMPLAALAAASALPLHRLRTALALLAAQGIATSLLFATAW
jgi:methylthioxylose transferase